jgi:hypothetical protein
MGAKFEAFRQARDQPHAHGVAPRDPHAGASLAQCLGRAGEQDDVRAGQCRPRFRGDLQCRRQRDPGQLVGVFVGRRQHPRLVGTPRHKRDGVAGPHEVQGKRRAPSAGSDDHEIHVAD